MLSKNMENKAINIGTHSVKALDSRQKQCAIRTELNDLGQNVFASHLLKKKYFAVPRNAANLTIARQEAAQANEGNDTVETTDYIPKIEDGRIKQLLLPYLQDYLSITPVPSLHVMDNLNKYSLAIGSYHKQCVQPVGAATANHGDPICAYRGYLKLIRNWIPKYQKLAVAEFESPVILITARCENMNISSSYVSVGLPPLTAIGGFIHTIERRIGKSLPFGFGIQNFGRSVTSVKRGSSTIKGIPSVVKPEKIALFTDEITTNAEVAFILKSDDPETLNAVQKMSKKMNRFSGGVLWDIKVKMVSSVADYYWYQKDQDPTLIAHVKLPEDIDYKNNLKADQLTVYQQWEHENPIFSGFIKSITLNYRLIQSGYALLNEPVLDDKARSNSKLHAWAEPVFSLIELGNEPTFFKLTQKDNLFIWS